MHVHLPPLPKGVVWKNVFTHVETNTSGGGKNISEAAREQSSIIGLSPLGEQLSACPCNAMRVEISGPLALALAHSRFTTVFGGRKCASTMGSDMAFAMQDNSCKLTRGVGTYLFSTCM